jgi:hypothetical protein
MTDEQILRLICDHTGKRINLPNFTLDELKEFANAVLEAQPTPKLVLALPDYDKRRIVVASDDTEDGERLVCVAIEDAPIRYDIARMQKALDSGSVAIPSGLTREEIRDFILSHADAAPTKLPEPIDWAAHPETILPAPRAGISKMTFRKDVISGNS